jgi:hypothetical protein
VTATVALVLAIGGGAYAAATIDSGDVVDNSLRSRDIRNDTLNGRDVDNESLTARDIASLADSGGIVKLQSGDSATVLRKGPFTLIASCGPDLHNDAPPDSFHAAVVAQSDESGAIADFGPGQAAEIEGHELGPTSGGPAFEWRGGSYFMATPGGDTAAGYAGAGVHALGADCVAFATGEGGAGVRHGAKR